MLAITAAPAIATQVVDTTYRGNLRAGFLTMPTPASIAAAHSYRDRLNRLRADGLRLQAADGGRLTDAHRGALQARLDRIDARFVEKERRLDPFAVNYDGSGTAVWQTARR